MTVHGARWYRVPIVWLGAAILCASILGCIGMILLAARYPDEALSPREPSVLKIPESREPAARP